MDRHDKTPEEGMRVPRDTPARPLTPLDEEVVSYLASTPPPPMMVERKAQFIHTRMRQEMQSGSWELDQLLGETRQFVIDAAAKKISEERADRDRERLQHEHERELDSLRREKEKAEERLESRNEADRKFRGTVLAGIIVGIVVVGAPWIASVLISASHHAP